jgi:diguanylate cyclase (GGDEF)-like protein
MALFSRPLSTPSTENGNRELVERLRWVIGLRWTVVIALFLVGFFGDTYGGDSVNSRAVHIGLALLVLTYNILYLVASRRPGFGHSGLMTLVRYGQVPIDLLVFTVLVHFTGGITGPVFVLYFLYIFVGLAILPPSGAYWVAGIAALCYGGLALLEAFWLRPPLGNLVNGQPSAVPPPQVYLGYFLTVSATLMITAYIANYFAGLLTRDEGTIRRQLDEMNTLYTVTRKISTTLNSDEVMRTLISVATEIEAPSACALILFNEDGEGICGATVGVSADEREKYQVHLVTLNNPLIKQIVADRKGLYAPITDAVPGVRSLDLRGSSRSFYALPMLNDDRLIGILTLSYDRSYTMPIGRWNLLTTVTQQAALAIDRTQLFADAERAAREMTGLYHIGLATTSSLQIDEVLRLIYEQVNRVLHPDTFYIGLYEEEAGELNFDMFVENGEFLPPFRTRLEGGISAWVVRNRRPIFVRSWTTEIEQLPFEAGVVGAPTQSVISVPLMAKNKMVGVMSVQSLVPDAFDQDHLRLLTSIAGQAALALENAKLHAQVNEQAQRDSLTGAYNHGTFIDKLHSMVRQANVNRQTVALIMLDIDRFKQYNDTYGHMVGDDVLRSIVVAIQNHLKSTDIVGRWGGEEFGIILPEVNRTQARLIAERIRQTAAHTMLKDLHNRSIPSPTVSQGIALYPDDATNIEEFIDKADSALFRAKDLGRNQIAEWIDLEGDRGPISFRARG